MLVLGLNFGHDASVCVVHDGKVLVNIWRERFVRVKHAMEVRPREIDLALADAGLSIEDIDYCAVTTSQGYPYTFFKDDGLSIDYLPDSESAIPMSRLLTESWPERSRQLRAHGAQETARFSGFIKNHESTRRLFADPVEEISHCLPTRETYINLAHWQEFLRVDQISQRLSPAYLKVHGGKDIRHAFHFPATVTF